MKAGLNTEDMDSILLPTVNFWSDIHRVRSVMAAAKAQNHEFMKAYSYIGYDYMPISNLRVMLLLANASNPFLFPDPIHHHP